MIANKVENIEKLKKYLQNREAISYDIVDLMKWMACKYGVKFKRDEIDKKKMEELSAIIQPKEKILFVLLDGFGYYKADSLPEESLFKEHTKVKMNAIIPTSTACILTSMCSASYPTEHGIFGWWQYSKKLDIQYYPMLFQGRRTSIDLKEKGIAPKDIYHFQSIFDRMNTNVNVYMNRSFVNSEYSKVICGKKASRYGYYSVKESTDRIAEKLKERGNLFHYLYIDGLDLASHIYGIDSKEANDIIQAVEKGIQHILKENEDVTVILTADHGQVDMTSMMYLNQTQDYSPYFYALPSIDTRMISFFVKEECRKSFETKFMAEFGEDVILLSIKEALEMRLFGENSLSEHASGAVGEYIGIIVNDKFLVCDKIGYQDKLNTKGNHSGLTKYETTTPLVVIHK